MKKNYLITLFTLCALFSHAIVISVTNTNDTGAGSLRAAVDSVNQSGTTSTVQIQLTKFDTIKLLSALSPITVHLTIKGPANGNPTIMGSVYADCKPTFYANNRNLVINNLDICNCLNDTWGEGGAIYCENLQMNNCFLYNNQVFISTVGGACVGGAACTHQNMICNNCTFYNNRVTSLATQANGGAVSFFGGGSKFYNCTFVNNQVDEYGSAMDGIPAEVQYCTFTGNHSVLGGLIYSNFGFSVFANNVFWNNTTDGEYAVLYYTRTCNSGGCNILQQRADDTMFVTMATDTFGINPQLGSLGYYGGVVPTIPIMCGSIAQDYGICNPPFTFPPDSGANDERIYNGVKDAGAFEVHPMGIGVSFTASSGTNGSATVTDTGGTKPVTYLWNNNQTTATITNLTPGTYTVTVTDKADCSLTASVEVISTHIDEVGSNENMEVYPNPATNQLTINLGGLQAEQVSIYNVDGKLISTTKQPAKNHIYISELANGVYIAEVKVRDVVQRVRCVKM